jgi:phospholipid:diacylglycerol acyltransferase
MCVEGWKRDLYNPAKIPVITHELKHEPAAFDPRGALPIPPLCICSLFLFQMSFLKSTPCFSGTGGPTTADHVDILGATELNDAVLSIVSGNEHEVEERFVSRIREYASKIRW